MLVSNNSYLVTGAAGFIGSNLVEALLERGDSVVGVDCFTEYYDPQTKRNNLRSARDHPEFRLLEKDLLQVNFERVLSGVDGVFHQAAQAGVRASWGEQFQDYVNCNIRSTQCLLESIKQYTPDLPMVMASSSSVYGIPDELPMEEEMHVQPFSPYGVTKLAAEHLSVLYAHNFDLRTANLRYFTVFGPRQRPDMAFTRFLTWGINEHPITVFGDGSQTRDFTFVDDIVQANLDVIESLEPGAVYNVGGGNRASLMDVFDLLDDLVDPDLKLEYESSVSGDVPHTDADVDRIEREVGWSAETSLEEGLREQYHWIKDRPDVQEAVLSP